MQRHRETRKRERERERARERPSRKSIGRRKKARLQASAAFSRLVAHGLERQSRSSAYLQSQPSSFQQRLNSAAVSAKGHHSRSFSSSQRSAVNRSLHHTLHQVCHVQLPKCGNNFLRTRSTCKPTSSNTPCSLALLMMPAVMSNQRNRSTQVAVVSRK